MHRMTPNMAAWVDLMVVDLGLLRLPFNRPEEVVPGIWRSNQPTPWRLRTLQKRGLQSVLNLRGEGKSGSFYLEQYCCSQTGMALHSLKLSSRRAPSMEQLRQLRHVFDTAPRPLLLHCKSGADRAGLVSALFMLWSGQPVAVAKKQLSLRYLHIKQAETGMMDWFLDTYESAFLATGIGFDDWLHKVYDRDQMAADFKPEGVLSWFVEHLLRRE